MYTSDALRETLTFPSAYRYFCILGLIGLAACAGPKDLYRISYIRLSGDSVEYQVVNKAATPSPVANLETEVTCLTCNLYEETREVTLDAYGIGRLRIPETRQLLSTRLKIEAHGIDTPAVILQPDPSEATRIFSLSKPLAGRVLLTGLSVFYYDPEFDSSATQGVMQDEVNLYEEQEMHFLVHHPNFTQPLYLPKTGVVRLR